MKIKLLNTAQGLKPLYDEDFDEKRKLKIGEVYEADIRKPRNILFHRKYFALINCAWNFANEKVETHFKGNVELFRKTVEMAAGFSTPIYSIDRKEWIEIPMSISFKSMTEDEFTELYERVKDVLYKYFLKHVTIDEFEEHLINF